MNDSEHTKTYLYLTDVAVLRNEGDTINLCGLNITMTSRGFEARNSTERVQSLSSLHWMENSKTTASPGRRFSVMELASTIPLQGDEDPTFRTAVEKFIFMAPCRADMQFDFQQ